MKNYTALLFILFVSAMASAALANDPIAEHQRLKVLHGRLHEVLAYRNIGLKQCAKNHQNNLAASLSETVEASIMRMDQTDNGVLELLEEYRDTHNFDIQCAAEMKAADAQLDARQRKPFKVPGTLIFASCLATGPAFDQCVSRLANVWADVDPHCYSVYDSDLSGYRDPNACYAATNLLAEEIIKIDPKQKQLADFIDLYNARVEAAREGDTIEWLNLGQPNRIGKTEKIDLFRDLSTLYTASTSALGFMDDFGDRIWRTSVEKGDVASLTLRKYESFKIKSDIFFNITYRARQKHLRFTFNGEDVTRANHHTFIAAYLGCHYQNEGRAFAELIPNILGAAYETKDFLANKKNGMSTDAAKRKFEVDMQRYRQGARLGFELCHGS